mmetsp:Transcript_138104/g.429278  ORF Transcript_138104/g.429278 Transcript_138104/m.429278 type:complete len:452 (-) Transcript_138104:431-1786(-)
MLPCGEVHQEMVCHQDAQREAKEAHDHLECHYPPEACRETMAKTFSHNPLEVWVDVGTIQDLPDPVQDGSCLDSDAVQINVLDARAKLAGQMQLSVKILVHAHDLVDILLCSLGIARDRVVHVAPDVIPAGIVGIRVRVCLVVPDRHLDVAERILVHVHAEDAGDDTHCELHRRDGRDRDNDGEEDHGEDPEPAIHTRSTGTAVEAASSDRLDQDEQADARHQQHWEQRDPDKGLHVVHKQEGQLLHFPGQLLHGLGQVRHLLHVVGQGIIRHAHTPLDECIGEGVADLARLRNVEQVFFQGDARMIDDGHLLRDRLDVIVSSQELSADDLHGLGEHPVADLDGEPVEAHDEQSHAEQRATRRLRWHAGVTLLLWTTVCRPLVERHGPPSIVPPKMHYADAAAAAEAHHGANGHEEAELRQSQGRPEEDPSKLHVIVLQHLRRREVPEAPD